MRVQALEKGFHDGRRRYPGDEFEYPDELKPGAWMKVLEGPKEPQAWQKEKPKPKDKMASLEERLAALEGRVAMLEAPAEEPVRRGRRPKED